MKDKQFKRIEDLLETLVKINLAPVIKSELSDSKMKRLYEMTGKYRVTEISKKLGFATGKISLTWQRWERQGLLKKEGKSYRKVLE
jgi:hypothetical protein